MTCFTPAPVVFLHGTAASPQAWRDLISHLPATFETLAPDLPSGVIHSLHSTPRSLSQEAQSVAHRLHGLGRPFHLVGHSYGGALALIIAMQWPGLVRSLTLFEPAMFHLLRDGHAIERQMHGDIAALEHDLRKAVSDDRPQEGVARFIDYWNGRGSFAVYAPERQEKATQRMPMTLANFTALNQETWPLSDCARVACPTLGVFGENSPLLVQHLMRLIAGAMDDAKVVSVSAAGHMLPMTHAHTAAKILRSHILAAETHASKPRAA